MTLMMVVVVVVVVVLSRWIELIGLDWNIVWKERD